MILFNGYQAAQQREVRLADRVTKLINSGKKRPKIAAILFAEDTGSQLYTRLKREAAERVGIGYEVHEFSLAHPEPQALRSLLAQLNADPAVTGVIIQKPWRSTWLAVTGGEKTAFADWWHALTSQIDERKDVDGLHPQTLRAIEQGTWRQEHRVLPATCAAVLSILQLAAEALDWWAGGAGSNGEGAPTGVLQAKKVIILGKSDLLGLPLFYELRAQGVPVELLTSSEFRARGENGQWLTDADIVVSATGRADLVTGEVVKEGAVVIDVGEPRGDVERNSVEGKAAFLTPVPGGVGPMTVVSLLENAVELVDRK